MNAVQRLIDGWRFRGAGEREWMPAAVPGCVHTDLLANGRIPDPFDGTNERDLQWIDKQDWEYETTFDVSGDLLGESRIDLVFDGLDTYADVTLNGEHVLSADNMFRVWRVGVKRLLKPAGNRLHIRFRSPIREDLPKLEKLGYPLPAVNDQSENGGLGDRKVSVFARKAPYHYGWDWGPRFVTSGIWREVRLEAWSGVRIADLFIRQRSVTEAEARLTAVVEVEAEAAWSGTLRLAADGRVWERDVSLEAGVRTVELDAVIERPRLWWCRGLGEQHLYTFRAELLASGRVAAARQVRTGLRSIRLVRKKDEWGTSFHFELNGVPVFAKGANHIPLDSFVTRVTRERYEHEIASAAQSNMNMLRVWGGGIYEDDAFYDLCDEYGILVWQDFMFACSLYPGDEAFLENVRIEAEQNVKRLRNHPCIALWCGNNEIDTAWSHYIEDAGWGWKQQYPPELREKLWADYEKLFHELLPEVVGRLAPEADYWPSSPMQGLTRDANQHAGKRTTSGDIHYWGVWHEVEPFESYTVNLGRFMSEYGFQSFPEERTVRSYAREHELELLSDVMLSHQRHPSGNRLIKQYQTMYLPEPKDFVSFLSVSQVLQGEAMKFAIEAHRRRKPFCMGSLYWQLDDCWPVASWSSMDYYGRWKAIQYYAKRSMKDIIVSIDGTKEGVVDIHVVSDVLRPIDGVLRIALYDFDGRLLKESGAPAKVDANAAAVVWSASVSGLLGEADPRRTVLKADLIEGGRVLDSKLHYFVPAKEIRLSKANVTVREVPGSNGTAFTLETDTLAKQVALFAEAEGIFTDNWFDLIPGIPVTVEFLGRGAGGRAFAPARPGRLTVRSFADWIGL
ncbi:MAG: beta-galactosidase [Thermobacillus sp. ZCTH02-B1]|uniref:beta-mannosidase n=1 Tax=Thermobacillus sp. ZCTH02-B1 TaxID=1858795 RepID=UPI000B575DF3|nr:glycoside hydrolase family 2 protein [Thermobacillus sp. ZCTH02-B1]OUM94627.1 MAG: beta-galactosidase [Thermobacillus sp. ZCTH02-B1]